ncbi:MAG: hypothetical protein OXT65_00360 [Alphaproteobacteria bacterium]|nr:hypothetical protein [Alphaproteobacteria bacterium]
MDAMQHTAEASAPGNMILMGEYAVLEGAPAVLMTLRHRLKVKVSKSDIFEIYSDAFGVWRGGGAVQPHVALCRNVLENCGYHNALRIDITSDIPPTYGFGSSAALVAALVKALYALQGKTADFTAMFSAGHAAILATHGRGSGADLAAALADMPFVVFDPQEKTVQPFDMAFCVQAIYTGYKTPTPQVLEKVYATVAANDRAAIMADMAACVRAFITTPNVDSIRQYQSCMSRLEVICPATQSALALLEENGTAAKISGSGLGDCVVGFSAAPVEISPPPPLEFLAQKALCA